jgi:hypothetical protein
LTHKQILGDREVLVVMVALAALVSEEMVLAEMVLVEMVLVEMVRAQIAQLGSVARRECRIAHPCRRCHD